MMYIQNPYFGFQAVNPGHHPDYFPHYSYYVRQVNPVVLLARQSVDVTGDRVPDQVSLLGQRYSPETVYYRQLYIEVVDGATQRRSTIPLPGGYNPKMQFFDFNGDQVADIYVSAETGGSGGISDFHLYSVINNIPRKLPVPQPLTITGQFQDHYRVSLSIREPNRTYTLDLSEKKSIYDQAGYYRNGKLLTPSNILPNAYSVLRPVDPDRDGVYELYGVQRIAGFYNADTIADVTSLWKWERDRWRLVDVNVRKRI
ncbi:hypothetical protein [Lihuaxuella thermophila]|uniref:Repeat domain-containing protein n=1 Tax=Lihuaxuella thermophila TaxID=1173111 RepID=A0A1H8GXQ5_9BACL|nr:hypothetical protein [Lihuaxuella thermophila]SEN48921.1 hypothetical protein SAMN05444955_112128 [Lihuaxuella thermophila]